MSEQEKLIKLFKEMGSAYELIIATSSLKIIYNLPIEDRYEATEAVKIDDFVFFFDSRGRYLGAGTMFDDEILRQSAVKLGHFIRRID